MSGKVINESFSQQQTPEQGGQSGAVLKPSCPTPASVPASPLPTLCEMISEASAAQIFGCLSDSQVAGISALVCDDCEDCPECPECPEVPTLCELVSAATAASIFACMSQQQSDDMLNLVFKPIQILNSQDNEMAPELDAYVEFFYVNDILVETAEGVEITEISAPTKIVIDGPYTSVNQGLDGVVTIQVPSAIIYVSDSFGGQTDQFELYDAGWHYNNGTFDYGPLSGRLVSLALSGTDRFYRLQEPNAFGNIYRFTDSQGNPAPDLKNDWAAVDWAVDRPDAVNYYVIDHFRNRGWCTLKIGFNQHWGVALSSVHFYNLGGLTGFYTPTANDILGVLNKTEVFYHPSNIFNRADTLSPGAGAETGCWLSETNQSPGFSTQAYVFRNIFDISRATKTSPSFLATYICRIHYT